MIYEFETIKFPIGVPYAVPEIFSYVTFPLQFGSKFLSFIEIPLLTNELCKKKNDLNSYFYMSGIY